MLVTRAKFPETERIAPEVRVIFEVLSPESGRRDRIEKVREYADVASIRRYIIAESTGVGLFVPHRQNGDDAWTAMTLSAGNTLSLPEIGVSVPVADFHDDFDFAADTVGL